VESDEEGDGRGLGVCQERIVEVDLEESGVRIAALASGLNEKQRGGQQSDEHNDDLEEDCRASSHDSRRVSQLLSNVNKYLSRC